MLLLLLSMLLGCIDNPEARIVGRWREANWQYERLDLPTHGTFDTVEVARQADRRVVRHEAEYWEFRPDGTLLIVKRDGHKLQRRWHLKGRGHVLTIHADDPEELEVYDIKELNPRELVLHYDIGLEVRGIARLSFRNQQTGDALASARVHSANARGGR